MSNVLAAQPVYEARLFLRETRSGVAAQAVRELHQRGDIALLGTLAPVLQLMHELLGIDHVILHVPVRQWFPAPLRLLLAAQPPLIEPVLQAPTVSSRVP